MLTVRTSHVLAIAAPYLRLVDAVAVTDVTGAILTCNRAFRELLGLPRERLVGILIWTLLNPTGSPLSGTEPAAAPPRPGQWLGYVAFRHRDGSDRVGHVSITPLSRAKQQVGNVVVLREATPPAQEAAGGKVGSLVGSAPVQAHGITPGTLAGLVKAVARVAEARDPDVEGHLDRIEHVVRWLVGAHKPCASWLPEEREWVAVLSALHDIGKVGIPESLLFKPAALTAEERKLVERHTVIGERLIRRHMQIAGLERWMARAAEIARWHHERWDGNGYPDGLKGEAIPMAARIVAVADVLDALLSRRAYKEPWPWDKAVAYIKEQQARQFDPAVVETFLSLAEVIRGFYAARGMPALTAR